MSNNRAGFGQAISFRYRMPALLAASLAAFYLTARASEPAIGLQISIGGLAAHAELQPDVTVEQQRGRADLARLALTGPHGLKLTSGIQVGTDVRLMFRSPDGETAPLFTGEVLAVESSVTRDEPFVLVRAANRLHRLSAESKTRTFTDRTLVSIVATIAAEHGLNADLTTVPDTAYGEVHQANQTDLDFLLERAAEVGADVTVDGRTLRFRSLGRDEPSLRATPGPLGDIQIACLLPRLSASSSVQGVVVTGTHPETGEVIVGRAFAPTILLGDDGSREPFGRVLEVNADRPIVSVDDANARARSLLEKLLTQRISAEALTSGDPRISVGRFVEVEGLDVEFEGAYYVAGVSHRFTRPDESHGGYTTVLRVRRSDLGMFWIPQIDDEVIVTFELGDLNRPYIIGGLWDQGDATVPDSCDRKPACCSPPCCRRD